jgi:hypothetical protein
VFQKQKLEDMRILQKKICAQAFQSSSLVGREPSQNVCPMTSKLLHNTGLGEISWAGQDRTTGQQEGFPVVGHTAKEMGFSLQGFGVG